MPGMTVGRINYLAVIVAAAVAWLFGGLYYVVLGNVWLSALGKTVAEMQQEMAAKSSVALALPFVLSFIAALVMAWSLAGMIGYLGRGAVNIRVALIYSVTAWLGFTAATMAVNHAYQGRAILLTVVDSGHWLGVAIILGCVIGKFGNK